MGLGVRFDPRVIETPVGVLGDLLDELVGALAKSAKGGEGDRLEVDVQALLLEEIKHNHEHGESENYKRLVCDVYSDAEYDCNVKLYLYCNCVVIVL